MIVAALGLGAVTLPLPLPTGMGAPASLGILGQILWFFTKAGAFVFGSGLPIYGGGVQEYRWLNDKQFLDAVAVAMITPGPVVIPYPSFDRFSENPQVKAFVKGVTAAAARAIAGACFVLARRAIFDLPTLLMGVVTLAILTRFKVPEPVVIVAAGLLGMLIFSVRE